MNAEPKLGYDHLTHWRMNSGNVYMFDDLSTEHLYTIIQLRQQDPSWCGVWMTQDQAKEAFPILYELARKRCIAGAGGVVRVENVRCCLLNPKGREGEFVCSVDRPSDREASGLGGCEPERKELQSMHCDGQQIIGTIVSVGEKVAPWVYLVTLNVLPYMVEKVMAKWAMAQKSEYDVMTHWKSSDGRITKFEELDCNHLYNILNKRVTEPTWRGFVPEDKVEEVFTKLWAVARGHLHKWSKHTAAWFSATRGALAKVPGEWWVEKGYDGKVWVVTDGQAARSHPSKPIIGTIREVRNGLVSLNVLPHMVDWVKRNLEAQPMPQPTMPQPMPHIPWEQLREELRAEFNERLNKLAASITPILEEATKTLATLKEQLLTLQAAIFRSDINLVVERLIKTEKKDHHAAQLQIHKLINRIETDVDRLRGRSIRRTLWRLLPWIMTAVLGIGLGIANHYEGWIKLEWQDEAANR